MNQQTANSNPINEPARCQRRSPSGRRCKSLVTDASSGLCFDHARLQQHAREAADLSSDLLGEVREFKSASEIQGFLAKLLCLLAQNRVATKRAAVMAYITNQLLRALTAIQQEANTKDTTIIIDIDSAVAHRALEARRAEREHSTENPS